MTINLGLYDFFSYLIPGLLYLFTFGKLLVVLGWDYTEAIPWASLDLGSIVVVLPIVALAYLLGHLMDMIANKVVSWRIRNIRNPSEKKEEKAFPIAAKALKTQKEIQSNLAIEFRHKDWFLLFNLIAQRNLNLSQYIDKYQADSLMLRNISLGSFLFGILQFVSFISTPSPVSLLIAIIVIVFSILAYLKSEDFRYWYFSSIFEASLEYGLSLEEVVKYNHLGHDNKTKK